MSGSAQMAPITLLLLITRRESATVQILTAYYERRRSQMDRNSYVDVGLVEHDEKRLKLSHHPDGFVVFAKHR